VNEHGDVFFYNTLKGMDFYREHVYVFFFSHALNTGPHRILIIGM